MNRYNAEQERAAGRRTLDDTERPLYFGPARDSTALTRAVSNILRLKISNSQGEPERVFQRTKTGKHFWVDPAFAKLLPIRTTNPGGLQKTEGRELATIHDTVEGIIGHVIPRAALRPDEIVGRLRHAAVPSTELVTLPPPASTELAIPPRQIITLEQRPIAPVIPLHQFAELPDYVPEPLPAVASVAL